MNVLLFGASGRTGRELLPQVLARGHDVTAIVRDPENFEIAYDRLTVVKGDVLDPHGFGDAMAGQDAVLSALGVTGFLNSLQPMTFYEESTKTITEQMHAHDVQRLVLVSSVGVIHDPSTPIWYRTIVQPLLRHKYADMRQMERVAARSGLDWTVVRAGRLTSGPLTQHYRVGPHGTLPDVTTVSRSDLADFLAVQATDRALIGQAVALSY